ncbi:hypothetical protein CONPUDRAFT_124616 [Coniophora puteana RWD-64-598 SS2]|uniref:Zinc finger PHD-type domain-containing protein n=1 Tax=Coniophora puteana (strain RWD-64-598) TaxID=741705 RepID=A0A5M3MR00_CONPW|nr:uncharacterized protein CONPUDRAFT_124616 [Coniophora puteana RWD-64-598 SS2]EIW81500.1 hypothetical protein CONPUDRAFT_124616 [Coniophora puteana RWD-64-598 SS2]
MTYHTFSGALCFSADSESSDPHNTGEYACPSCSPEVTFDADSAHLALAHIGSHILFDPHVERELEPCGMCLRSFVACRTYLKKTRGRNATFSIDHDKTSCVNPIKFRYGVAREFRADTAPSTNHPIECPLCERGSPAVWSYNFEAHLKRVHTPAAYEGYQGQYKLTNAESAAMETIWRNRRIRAPQTSKKGKEVPVVISAAHSVHAATSTTICELEPEAESSSSSDSEESFDENRANSDDDDAALAAPLLARPSLDTSTGPSSSGVIDESLANSDDDDAALAAPLLARPSLDAGLSSLGDIALNPFIPPAGVPAIADDAEAGSRRSARKRKARDTDDPKVCYCGERVLPSEPDIIKCTARGCETVLFHLKCSRAPLQRRQHWRCEPCRER